MRDVEFTHRNFDFHPRVIGVTQYFHDTACRHIVTVTVGFQGYDHYLLRSGARQIIFVNQNIGAQAHIVGVHQPHAIFVDDMADHAREFALNDLNYIAFAFAVAGRSDNAHGDFITVPRGIHVALVNEHIFAVWIVDETVTVTMRLQCAIHQIVLAVRR